jgi:formamidopyrimidine-DNA glycosylase
LPELPEAETIVRGLRSPLRGRFIARVEVLHSDLLEGATPGAFRGQLEERAFGRIQRRGKNLVLAVVERESGESLLVVNLGMSGRLLHRVRESAAPPSTHPGVRFHLDGGGELVYHDPRRFGRLRVLDPAAYRTWSDTLGPEPLGPEFTPERLRAAVGRSAAPLRSWLLDQKKVAGIGNIYANEALFLAGLHPEIRGRDAPPSRVDVLHSAIRTVLSEAVQARGTTLRDYRTAEGWEGSYARSLRVYGREGLPCPTCKATVKRAVFGGRSAFFCPACQRAPRGRTA